MHEKTQKRLLLVGNHGATTAVSIIEEIKKRNLDWEIFWIGKKWAGENKKSYSLEYNILPKLGVNFVDIESGKIQTKFTRYTIPALLKIPVGFLQSYLKLSKIKPDLVLSLGGASGALVAFWAWVLKIPVVIHEQTASGGRANIRSSKFASKILLSRKNSFKYFPEDKSELVGNPIPKNILGYVGKKPNKEVKTILVTGGSRGSVWINSSLKPILPDLASKYNIIHQTGEEDFDNFKNIRLQNYKAVSQVFPEQMGKLYDHSDVVISRAGANTVSALIALKKPSLLIPIPWSYLDEQNENALFMQKLGLAEILPQEKLNPTSLLQAINEFTDKYQNIIRDTGKINSEDLHAAEKIVDHLYLLI